MPTAREVADQYRAGIPWVPVDRLMPPEGELVEVIYRDGETCQVKRSGNMFLMTPTGMYRYVEACFWRPLS